MNRKMPNRRIAKITVLAEERIGGPYCDPMCIKYFAPGVYMIEKGTVIGVAIPKQKDTKYLIK